jgi:Fe(3+) dicitrate transport protein
MFNENPFQSNRNRNWFKVNWLLYNLKYNLKINNSANFSFNLFGLEATRDALGFRTNRVDQIDPDEERDLIKGKFSNIGLEIRYLKEFMINSLKNISLIGMKYYKSDSKSEQGPGSSNKFADFSFDYVSYPNYVNQSNYIYPNKNFALFGENIIYLNEKISITPGFRAENIKTMSDGFYRKINLDAAGNVIYNERFNDNNTNKRSFLLFGLGFSYQVKQNFEIYANISQNYRSVTFADMSIINPAYAINPDITDEKGFTADFGIRGNSENKISFDISAFTLKYEDRIGFIQKVFNGNVKSERGNVGNAIIYGVETLSELDLNRLIINKENLDLKFFINYSFIRSQYLKSEQVGIEGNSVEFVPKHNLKSGLRFGYKNFSLSWQTSLLSSQFTDSSNAIDGNLSGVIGQIPSYSISDLSISLKRKKWKIESGVNNIFDEHYFTRRATGYPGPGIIPSPPRNFYSTIQIIF